MCGIVGVYHFDRERPVEVERLVRQTDTLRHRGPNDGAVWTAPGIGLGHRRLSIIDLGGGQQPMVDASKRYVVAFNGEIYNYRELKKQLAHHPFRTDSDTETLLYAYAEWGEGCVEHLNGMFAFAVYDRETHELFLARDRLGQKPLYYYQDADRLIFASELKAIVADPTVPKEIEPTAIADFFALSYVPGPKTIYKRTTKLPAGHLAVVRPSGIESREYWDVDFTQPDHTTSAEVHAERLLDLLEDAVRLRLRSDVPLGAFLSGGVDSSATVAVMAQLLDRPVVTNSIGFDVAQFDEREYARQVAERFATEHHEKVLSPRAGHVVNQLSWFYDEPFGDSSAVPTYYLCEMTKAQVTVAVSGDGGDELFAGYTHYSESQWANSIRERVPRLLRQAARIPLRHLFQVTRYNNTANGYNMLAWRVAQDRDRGAYDNLLPQPWRFADLLDRDFLRALDGYDPFESVAHLYEASGTDDPIARMQYADIKAYLCDDILVKVDRASMAHALEARCPFLDYRVVDYAARIPPALNLEGTKTKQTLKRAIAHLIEPSFFERPKQGFAIPIAEWFRTALVEPTTAAFFGGSGSGLLDGVELRRRWWEHQRGFVNHGTPFWNGLMFELWYARFMANAGEAVEPTGAMAEARPTRLL